MQVFNIESNIMNPTSVSVVINILLIVAFIIDRLFRIHSIKEYKEAKEAQISGLKQQVEFAINNNDIALANMHKERYENLKIIVDEKEVELEKLKNTLLEIQSTLNTITQEADLKTRLNKHLVEELNKVEKSKHTLEVEKKALLLEIEKAKSAPIFDPTISHESIYSSDFLKKTMAINTSYEDWTEWRRKANNYK